MLALSPPLWVIAVTYCVAGLASGLLNPMIGAIFFERIPRPLIGRVGPLDATAWAAMPFGGLVAAALVATAGLGPGPARLGRASTPAAILVPALGNRASFDPPTDADLSELASLESPSATRSRGAGY